MSVNRQQRRLMQRQGQLTEEGEPAAPPPPEPAPPTPRPSTGAPHRRTSPRQFMHEVNVELRKVAWPTREETTNYSTVVFIALAFMMALIFGFDLAFSHLASFLFK